MSDLNTLTIAEARDKLRAKDITSLELTEACLTQIEASGALNAFVHNTPDLAREQAAAQEAPPAAVGLKVVRGSSGRRCMFPHASRRPQARSHPHPVCLQRVLRTTANGR